MEYMLVLDINYDYVLYMESYILILKKIWCVKILLEGLIIEWNLNSIRKYILK